MGKDKGFRKIGELVVALAEAERALQAGSLGLEGLDTACTNARSLYERLIVLRHKAREAAIANAPVADQENASGAERTPVKPAPAAIRLDTRPPESPHRQTSLIDAIEATESAANVKGVEPSAGPERAEEGASATRTVAEKMEHASITDLGKAISLSHKFWFVAELFNGDRTAYEKALDRLNGFSTVDEAFTFLENDVEAKLKKPADPEALTTFRELIQRRYA